MEEAAIKLEPMDEILTSSDDSNDTVPHTTSKTQRDSELLIADKRYEIAAKIEEGTYTLSLSNRTGSMWKILRTITNKDNIIIEGYLWCIKCRRVLTDCAKVFTEHPCCKELKDTLANKAATDEGKKNNLANRKPRTKCNVQKGIAKKIKKGTYSLSTFNGKSIVWQILRKIIDKDKSVVEGYVWCTKCCKVIKDYGSNISRHKCSMVLKEASDTQEARLARNAFQKSVNRAEVAKKIEKGVYTLTPALGRRKVRQIVQRILKEDKELLQGYVFCMKCRKVFSDVAAQATKHTCYIDIKYLTGNNSSDDGDDDDGTENMEKRQGYVLESPQKQAQRILEQIEKGNYHLEEYEGRSVLGKNLRIILNAEKTIVEDVLFCTQCCKVCIKRTVYVHKCCKPLEQAIAKNTEDKVDDEDEDDDRSDLSDACETSEMCSQLASKIKDGIYILSRSMDKDYVWNILRNILREDDTLVEGYVVCIKCNKVFPVYRRIDLYNHKCCKILKKSMTEENMEDEDIGNSTLENPIPYSETDIAEIAINIENGIYTLAKIKRRCFTRQIMELIVKDDKTICKGLLYCILCLTVVKNLYKGQYFKHKCYSEYKDKPGDIPKVLAELQSKRELAAKEDIEIDKHIGAGTYILRGKRSDLSTVWDITSEVQRKDNGTILESHIGCSKCKKALRFLGYQSLDIYKYHKCIRDQLKELESATSNTTFTITEIEESKRYPQCIKTEIKMEMEQEELDISPKASNEVISNSFVKMERDVEVEEEKQVIKSEPCDDLLEESCNSYETMMDNAEEDSIPSNRSTWKIIKAKILAKIEKGIYTLAKDYRASHIWRILRHIVMEDGTYYKGYVQCIQCHKVIASNIMSGLYQHKCCQKLMELKVKKTFKDLQPGGDGGADEEEPDQNQIPSTELLHKPKKRYHINNEIAEKVKNGTFTLAPFLDNSYRWQIIRHIVKEDNTHVKDYVFCIQCQRVYLSRNISSLYRHQCLVELKESLLNDIGENASAQHPGECSSIGQLVAAGVYTLCDRKLGSNYIWNFMREIKREDGSYMTDFICCYKCNRVLRFLEDSSLDIYNFHKCAGQHEKKSKQHKEDGENQCEVYIDKDFIAKQLQTGVYSIARRMKGNSYIWRIMGEIQKEDGTYLSDVISCRKCPYIFRLKMDSVRNLYRHKCIVELKKTLESIDNPSEMAAFDPVEETKDYDYDNLEGDSIKIEPEDMQENSHFLALKTSEEIREAQQTSTSKEQYEKLGHSKSFDPSAEDFREPQPSTSKVVTIRKEIKQEPDLEMEQDNPNDSFSNQDLEPNHKISNPANVNQEETVIYLNNTYTIRSIKKKSDSYIWNVLAELFTKDKKRFKGHVYCRKCKKVMAYKKSPFLTFNRHECCMEVLATEARDETSHGPMNVDEDEEMDIPLSAIIKKSTDIPKNDTDEEMKVPLSKKTKRSKMK
ncbi:uncharacterized protein LOC142222322 [Haematobia irritans]|uniref:uncharacterized protein LOC142222322 n=1 Tax=Haematobia irritans TaxID=7368 RepID=UPI003F5092A9